MTDNQAQAQDEARRKLIEEIEARRNLADALETTAAYSGGTAVDLAVLTYAHLPVILAALRADPARGAEEMRERAAQTVEALDGRELFNNEAPLLGQVAAAIRALPAAHGGGE